MLDIATRSGVGLIFPISVGLRVHYERSFYVSLDALQQLYFRPSDNFPSYHCKIVVKS